MGIPTTTPRATKAERRLREKIRNHLVVKQSSTKGKKMMRDYHSILVDDGFIAGKHVKRLNVVAISDTHGKPERMKAFEDMIEFENPDVIIHAGDICMPVDEFLSWFSSLDAQYKLFTPGNHDFAFAELSNQELYELAASHGVTCLIDNVKDSNGKTITFHEIRGFKFFGFPYVPYISGRWVYEEKDVYEELVEAAIEGMHTDIDVLVTHTPPWGILASKWGSELLAEIFRDSYEYTQEFGSTEHITYHIFGHIHEARGVMFSNGTQFRNVAIEHQSFTIDNRRKLAQLVVSRLYETPGPDDFVLESFDEEKALIALLETLERIKRIDAKLHGDYILSAVRGTIRKLVDSILDKCVTNKASS